MRILLSAPYVGEIGWELMAWQGRVRWVFARGGFDRLVVLGASGKSAFYADMPLHYRAVDLSSLPGAAYEDRRYDGAQREPVAAALIRSQVEPLVAAAGSELRSAGHEVEVLWPTYEGKLWNCNPREQRFVRFHLKSEQRPKAPWVVMVQRKRTHNAGVNWPAETWDELTAMLANAGIHTNVFPCDSEAAIRDLSACDLAIGYSTGGLHLASLCECPHVAWGVPEEMRASPWDISTRQRYQTFWNPLGTPVHYYGVTKHPTVSQVRDWVLHGLEAIGRTTGSRLARGRQHAAWTVRSWLAWNVVRTAAFRHWPWPAQRFVRFGLL